MSHPAGTLRARHRPPASQGGSPPGMPSPVQLDPLVAWGDGSDPGAVPSRGRLFPQLHGGLMPGVTGRP